MIILIAIVKLIKPSWKAAIFTKIWERCPSLAHNVLLILSAHILWGVFGEGAGGVGWTAHLIRALTSPLSKSDEIIPNWCQYGLGFSPLQAHWQVRLQEGTRMKSVFFGLLKPLFLREDTFLQNSLMTAFEVLINPWPCSFKTPWILWLLGGKKREMRENKSKLVFANKVFWVYSKTYIFTSKVRVGELRLFKVGGGAPCCSEKKSMKCLEEITWGLLRKRITWPSS